MSDFYISLLTVALLTSPVIGLNKALAVEKGKVAPFETTFIDMGGKGRKKESSDPGEAKSLRSPTRTPSTNSKDGSDTPDGYVSVPVPAPVKPSLADLKRRDEKIIRRAEQIVQRRKDLLQLIRDALKGPEVTSEDVFNDVWKVSQDKLGELGYCKRCDLIRRTELDIANKEMSRAIIDASKELESYDADEMNGADIFKSVYNRFYEVKKTMISWEEFKIKMSSPKPTTPVSDFNPHPNLRPPCIPIFGSSC